MKNYRKLKVWQKGMEIVMMTYKLANQLPMEERYGLRSQITRSAVSIPSNIAEGSAKGSKKDYKNYLEISLGSAHELETQVLIIDMLKFGEPELIEALLKGVDEKEKMLRSFIKIVESS
jgi:four helix bundle protein